MDATQYLIEIFGPIINGLLDGTGDGDGSLVMTALDVITGAAIIAMGFFFAYIIYVGFVRLNAAGEFTGRRLNSYSLILRLVISVALILPINGMAPIHKLTLWVVAESSEWTDEVWVNKLKPAIATTPNPTRVRINSIFSAGNALRILSCSVHLNQWSGEHVIRPVPDGYDFGDGKCGQIRWTLALRRLPASSLTRAQEAVSGMFHELLPIAHEIYQQQYTTQGQLHAVGLHYTDDFITDKADRLITIAQRYSSRLDAALVAANLSNADLGDSWFTAGSRWSTIAAARSKAHAGAQEIQKAIRIISTTEGLPVTGRDDMTRVGINESALNKINRAVKAITGRAATKDTESKLNTPQEIEFTPSIACSDFSCSLEKLEDHTADWLQGAVLGRLANSGDDPYSGLIDTGNLMTSTARDLYIWQGILAPARSVPGVGYVAEEAQKLMSELSKILQKGGVMLAIWLPNAAAIIWSLMIISWTLAIIGSLIAGLLGLVVLPAPHDNSTVIPPVAKAAFMLTLAAAVMPIITTVGLAVSTIVITVVIKAVNWIFWSTGIADSTSGVINTVGMIMLYIYSIIGAIIITFMGLIYGLYKTIASIFSVADSSGVGEHHVSGVGAAGGGAAGTGTGTSSMSVGKMGRGGKGGSGNSIKGK